MDHRDRGAYLLEHQRVVDGAVAAADDEHSLVAQRARVRYEVPDADALVLLASGQRPWREDADAGGDQDRLGVNRVPGVGGDQQRSVVERRELIGAVTEQEGRVVGLRLPEQVSGKLTTKDRRDASDVVDHLLRIERRQLPAGLGQRIDDDHRQGTEAGVVRGVQAGRARTDDEQVDVVLLRRVPPAPAETHVRNSSQRLCLHVSTPAPCGRGSDRIVANVRPHSASARRIDGWLADRYSRAAVWQS